jgi:hypothetical protein
MSRIEAKRAILQEERKTITALEGKINTIVDELGLDEEKMQRRIEVALRSEYGRVNGMVNLLAAICNWPADSGDGASVGENRKVIKEKLKIDLMLLEDIRTYRGFHSFHTDELEIIDGVEPQYEDYEDYVAILLQDMGLTPYTKATINPEQWEKAEERAKEKAKLDVESMRIAVERHKAMLEDID